VNKVLAGMNQVAATGLPALLKALQYGGAVVLLACSLIPGRIAIAQTRAATAQRALPSKPGRGSVRTSGFEVASVRIVPPNERGYSSISPPGAEFFVARRVSLALLIEYAFGVNGYYQISGKRELGSESYDVAAKPWGNRGLTYRQLKPLLQQLIQQRFHLTYHYETKLFKGYALVIAKGGPKLHATKGGAPYAYILRAGLRAQNISVAAVAGMLVSPLRAPVIDRTGLKGKYDIKLDYAPYMLTNSPEPLGFTAAHENLTTNKIPVSSLPSLFTAVQKELGLKLVSQQVPVKMFVIDHVDTVPTQN
jgi:uncharacterized protein (TIGR03435 family)